MTEPGIETSSPFDRREFYATYFYPEKTKEHVEWTTRCLEQLALELRA